MIEVETYICRFGDDLSRIAAELLGDWERWTEIAAMNGIRDPRNVTVGQVIRIPI